MDALRLELGPSTAEPSGKRVKRIYRLKAGLYLVERENGVASRIEYTKQKDWVRTDSNGQRVRSDKLETAKEQAYRDFGRVEVE